MNAKRSLREIGKLSAQMFEHINRVKFLGFLVGKNANLTQVVDINAIIKDTFLSPGELELTQALSPLTVQP
ncbi:MAG: hypothetical protein ACKPA9_18790 [Microcystis sp.]